MIADDRIIKIDLQIVANLDPFTRKAVIEECADWIEKKASLGNGWKGVSNAMKKDLLKRNK